MVLAFGDGTLSIFHDADCDEIPRAIGGCDGKVRHDCGKRDLNGVLRLRRSALGGRSGSAQDDRLLLHPEFIV